MIGLAYTLHAYLGQQADVFIEDIPKAASLWPNQHVIKPLT